MAKINIKEKNLTFVQFDRKMAPFSHSLKDEVDPLLSRLAPVVTLWQQGKISPAEMAALYILVYLQLRPPHGLALAPQRESVAEEAVVEKIRLQNLLTLDELPLGMLNLSEKLRQRLPTKATLFTLFNLFSLRNIPLSVNKSLVHWMSGKWPLRLITHIPSPVELLREQSEGGRYVTMILARDLLGQLVLGQRDPFDFLLHDLTHADRFFGQSQSFQAQVGFFRQIYKALKLGFFSGPLRKDPIFRKELEYVFADMNSYCGHLLKCLKAVFLRFYLRRDGLGPNDLCSEGTKREYEDFFASLCTLWGMQGEEKEAALRLNTSAFNPEKDFGLLEQYFLRHGSSLSSL